MLIHVLITQDINYIFKYVIIHLIFYIIVIIKQLLKKISKSINCIPRFHLYYIMVIYQFKFDYYLNIICTYNNYYLNKYNLFYNMKYLVLWYSYNNILA